MSKNELEIEDIDRRITLIESAFTNPSGGGGGGGGIPDVVSIPGLLSRLDTIDDRLGTIELAFVDPEGGGAPTEELVSVPGLLARLTAIESFVNGPPELEGRLIELEENVQRFKDAVIISEAGIEDRQGVINKTIFEKLGDLFGITSGMQNASLRLFSILALLGAVVISLGWKIFGG